jgi:translocation and assembly module TamB
MVRLAVKLLVYTGLAVVLALSAAFVVLQTPPAKRALARWVESVASKPGRMSISLGEIEGFLPIDVGLSELVLSDPQGPWLRATGLRAAPTLADLAAGRIRIDRLYAAEVDLMRLPELDRSSKDDEPYRGFLSVVDVGKLRADDVRIGKAVLEAGRSHAEAANAAGQPSGSYSLSKVRLGGSFDLRTLELQVKGSVAAASLQTLLPQGEVGGLSSGKLSLSGWVRGTRVALRSSLALKIADPTAGDLHAHTIAATVTTAPRGEAAKLHVQLKATADGVNVAGELERVAELLGDNVQVDAVADVGVGGALDVGVERAHLAAAGIDVAVAGNTVDSEHAELSKLEVAVMDVAPLARIAGIGARGSVRLKASGEVSLAAPSFHGDASVTGSDLQFDDAALAALIGDGFELATKVSADGEQETSLRDIALSTGTVAASGSVTFDPRARSLSADVEAGAADLASFSDLAGVGLAGGLRATAKVGGPLDSLSGDLTITPNGLIVNGSIPVDGEVTVGARGVPSRAAGKVRGRLEVSGRSLAVDAEVERLGDATLVVRNGTITSEANEVEVAGRVDLDSGLVDATASATLARLAPLADWFGIEAAGSVEGRLALSPHEGRQDGKLTLAGHQLYAVVDRRTRVDAEQLSIDADLRALRTGPEGSVHTSVTGLRTGVLAVASADVDVGGDGKSWRFDGEGSGSYGQDFTVKTKGALRFSSDGWMLAVDEGSGSLGGEALALEKPFSLAARNGGYDLHDLALDVAGGRATADLRLTDDAAVGKVRLEMIPLRLTRLADPDFRIKGRLSGTLEAEHANGKPRAQLALDLEDVRLDTAHKQAVAADGSLSATWKGNVITVRGSTAPKAGTGVQLAADVATVADSGVFPSVDTKGPLHIRLTGDVDLALASELLNIGEERVGGQLSGSLVVKGSIDDPEIGGDATIHDGIYESAYTGALITDIQARLEGKGRRLVLSEFTADDGGEGRLTAEGRVDFGAGLTHAAYSLAVGLQRFYVARLDDLTVQAGGNIEVSGRLAEHARVEGKLEALQSDVAVPNRLPPEVVALDVVDVNVPGVVSENAQAGAGKPPTPTDLDLEIVLPGRTFVRGLIIESEWAGKVTIRGTAAKPVVTGQLQMVRGTFNFLGIPFKPQHAEVRFDGGERIDPILDIVGEAHRNDVLARVAISGTASSPKITLSSEPELPQDEVLSRLIFGRSVSDLSPIQALQLANSLRQLAGNASGGGGLLSRVRKAIGVDVVDIEQDTTSETEPTVGVGKYVANGVFVRLNQGLTSESTKATVEVEVTHNLSVETQVGANAQGSIGLNWRWNY